MNEKDLNIEYICEKTLLNKDDELVPIILSLIQESYKAGLCQAEFDNTMNLIEENQELKKQLHEASLTIQEMTEQDIECPSNCEKLRQLKKQLEEWKHHLKCSKEMLDIQGQKGNYDYDEYMLGLYNGMEYIIALFETREPNYISGKDVEFTNNRTQQKEFIKYLEDVIKELQKIKETELDYDILKDVIPQLLAYEEILQKHKEITQTKNNNSV